jgi:hypothetical protein
VSGPTIALPIRLTDNLKIRLTGSAGLGLMWNASSYQGTTSYSTPNLPTQREFSEFVFDYHGNHPFSQEPPSGFMPVSSVQSPHSVQASSGSSTRYSLAASASIKAELEIYRHLTCGFLAEAVSAVAQSDNAGDVRAALLNRSPWDVARIYAIAGYTF